MWIHLFLTYCVVFILSVSVRATDFSDVYFLLNQARQPPVGAAVTTESRKKIPQLVGKVKKINLHHLVEKCAGANGITPALLALLVAIESSGNPCAVSQAGAIGLGQLMPSTARSFNVTDPFSPEKNLEASAMLIKELLDQNSGNLLRAVASYNAGPGVLNRHWSDWQIETRGYLEKIVDLYPRYAGQKWKRLLPKFIIDSSQNYCL